MVAELNFAFWETTFTAGQDTRLWVPHFREAFPGVPVVIAIQVARAAAYEDLRAIRYFRNRITHHEPVFTRNIATEYRRLHDVIGWRSPVVAAWMDKTQGVTALIPLKP